MSRKKVRNNLPVVEVFVRVFVNGAVVVSVEQFADFRTPEEGMEIRNEGMKTCTGRRNKEYFE